MPSRVAAVPDLDRELDELYGLPLEQFTGARNDLVSRLRKAHQTEAADAVQSLRKPSLVIWAANQLARRKPKLVEFLIDAGNELRDVQQRALSAGEGLAEVTEAATRERQAIHALVSAADELGVTSAPMLDRLTQTLRAAAVDPVAAGLLAEGRLTDELGAVGFGPLEPVKAPVARASRADEARRLARERLTELRKEARRLDSEARSAEQAALKATVDAESKRADAQRAAADLAAAELELRASS
jgi:hypothetical protein